MLQRELYFALLGTGATCLATVLGAGTVFLFKKDMGAGLQRAFLGFAAGVMIAASVWSLLIPAMEMAEEQGQSALLAAGGGFVLGGVFLMLLDRLMPHLHIGSDEPEGLPVHLKRTTMVVLAVTLHNIPEGAAISLPLRGQGVSRGKAFVCGALSGVVEPVFGLLTVLAAGSVAGMMPWVLAFAAGAMIYVVVEELIPEAHLGEHSHVGTGSVMLGFLVMMLLDVALG